MCAHRNFSNWNLTAYAWGGGSRNDLNYAWVTKETPNYLNVSFPKNTSRPAVFPRGGLGFRSSPMYQQISNASILKLTYEVNFERGFDWVKGGKLPGLYGGRKGCSGGDGGVGEFKGLFPFIFVFPYVSILE